MKAVCAICLALCLLGAGCGSEPFEPQKERGLIRNLPAPLYHQPAGRWRAGHAALVQGPGRERAGNQAVFQWQECALCHDLKMSCDPCHAYLGAPLISRGLDRAGTGR